MKNHHIQKDLIQLNFDYVKDWALREGFDAGDLNEEVISHPRVIQKIQEVIQVVFAKAKIGNTNSESKVKENNNL